MFRGYIASSLRKFWEMFPWPETMEYQKEYFAPVYDPSWDGAVDDGAVNPWNSALGDLGIAPAGTVFYWAPNKSYYMTGGFAIHSENMFPAQTNGDEYPSSDSYYGVWAKMADSYQTSDFDRYTDSAPDIGTFFCNLADGTTRFSLQTSVMTQAQIDTFNTRYLTVTPFKRYVDKYLDSDGVTRTTEIGEVLSITQEDPRLSDYSNTSVNYEIIGDKILVRDDLPYVWVHYRTVPPALSTDPTTIPYRFAESCALSAAGKMLMADGKFDFGRTLYNEADEIMNSELDKVTVQEGQTIGLNVKSR